MAAPDGEATAVEAAVSSSLEPMDEAAASSTTADATKSLPHDKVLHNEVKPIATSVVTENAADQDELLAHGAAKHPFFYYQKSPSGSSQFLLHPQSIQDPNKSLYENYGTTLLLIIVLHIIYVYQWNKRYSKKDVCTNYEQLVEKKQYYRAVVAVMSHPPVDGGERGGSNNTTATTTAVVGSIDSEAASTNTNNGNAATATTGIARFIPCLTFLHRFLHSARRIKQQHVDRFLQPLVSGSLSGLPLLAFCSHILWQCRALEELYVEYGGTLVGRVLDPAEGIDRIGTGAIHMKTAESQLEQHEYDSYAYFRVLVTLALTALLLELKYIRGIVRRLDRTIGSIDNSRNSPQNILKQRSMVSLCSLCGALLTVYDYHFPFIQIPLLPFVRVSFLTNSSFNKTLLILILFVLGHRVHPISSVISGVVSGALWSLQITSFLGTKYWGDMMLWSLAIAIVLSLKANTTYTWPSAVIPCLDYVAWNREGEVVNTAASNVVNQSERNTMAVDLEMGDTSLQTNVIQTEHLPLLSQASTMSGSSTIRGRVPRIDTMASDRS
mmetsp:Transcript_17890/g.28084  ORF Transcript_17890/g.28084 Transcript_17890/m.28084 type:complete len:553 (-) Transcript_17890:39-1697(-)